LVAFILLISPIIPGLRKKKKIISEAIEDKY
jgi:hypothetical protein